MKRKLSGSSQKKSSIGRKTHKKEVIILGGGLAGLAAADRLLDDDKYRVTILEKLPYLGGLASTFTHGHDQIPKYYHHVISHNNVTKKFLDRFDLLDSCEWKRISVAIGVDGEYRDITKVFELLKFRYLSLYEKIRFGLFGLYVLFTMNPEKIPDDMDAKSWLTRRAGRKVTQKIFNNLYAKNKFNIDLSKISAKQFAHRLKEREVYDHYCYPKKGLQAMVDGLEQSIKKKGGKIIRSVRISSIDAEKKLIKFRTPGQRTGSNQIMKSEIIVNTIPVPEFLKLTSSLPQTYVSQLKRLRYCPTVCVTFGSKEFLDPKIYWFNIFKERAHVIMQHSILADRYKEKISWCLRYGGSENDLNLDDEEIKKRYLAVVRKYFPGVVIRWAYVFRDRYAEPVYDKDYVNYKPDYRTPVEGLYMAGIQVTYPKIRNMNSALESGVKVADMIINDQEDGT